MALVKIEEEEEGRTESEREDRVGEEGVERHVPSWRAGYQNS
jgi:hypothetical protein